MSEVFLLEKEMQDLDGTSGNLQKKAETFEKLQQAYQTEIIQLRQKARLKWDVEGDCNTRFFHKTIQQRRRFNQINKLIWRNETLISPLDIKKGLLNEFEEFYSNNGDTSPFYLTSLEWSIVTTRDAELMIREFSREEIWIALQECDSKKALGPDGLNAGWLKKVWLLLAEKVFSFFKEFHAKASIPQGANSSFIVLIPKKADPLCMLDFRPISLINTSIKHLLKVLAGSNTL